MKPATMAYAAAIGGGALLWVAAAAIGGRKEAWDAALYWKAAYPLTIALAAAVAYRLPERPWRWGLAAVFAQAGVLLLTGGGGNLLPLGLVVFAVLSLPAIVAAQLAAVIRRRRPGHSQQQP
jgi:hypothetical protein